MTGTRGSRKKTFCWTFFSKLVEHTLARPRTGTLEGAGRGRYRRTLEKCKKQVLFTLHTRTYTHTHSHTHAVAKGTERPPRRFFEVLALEPTLGLLLVFSIARHGMKGPALRGWSKPPLLS
jgi:hypothetical protein